MINCAANVSVERGGLFSNYRGPVAGGNKFPAHNSPKVGFGPEIGRTDVEIVIIILDFLGCA
jgi:hypothetical protein